MTRSPYSSIRASLLMGLILCSVFLLSCSSRITTSGLAYARIGDPFPSETDTDLQKFEVSDTLFNEGGFQWEGLILNYEDGQVWIESDFTANKQINRIRVESPALKFKKNIKVGNPATDLRKLAGEWDAVYLSAYELIDFVNLKFPQIHFLVSPLPDENISSEMKSIQPGNLKAGAKIVAIVVM